MPGTGLCGARRSYIGLPGTRTGRRPCGAAGLLRPARPGRRRPLGNSVLRAALGAGRPRLPAGAPAGCGESAAKPGCRASAGAAECPAPPRRGRRRRLQRRSRDARGRRRRGRRQRRNRPEFRLLNRACRRRRNLGRRPAELRRRRNRLAGHRRKIGTLGDLGDLRNVPRAPVFPLPPVLSSDGASVGGFIFGGGTSGLPASGRRGSRRRGCRCRRFPGNGLFLLFQQRRLEAADRRAKRLRSTAANADRREGGSGKRAGPSAAARSASGDRPRTFR